MNDFDKNGYLVIKNVISKDLCSFGLDYLDLLHKNGYLPHKDNKYLSGIYYEGTSLYGDVLLLKILKIIEENINIELVPTYSMARLYEKGSVLKPHLDRHACEVSCTLHLGSINCNSSWPIYLNDLNNKEVMITQSPGDIIIYRGTELKHWRDKFVDMGVHYQMFLHYIEKSGKYKNYDYKKLVSGLINDNL